MGLLRDTSLTGGAMVLCLWLAACDAGQAPARDLEAEKRNAALAAAEEAKCLKDANCLAARLLDKVSGPCSHEIERHSKFSFRWKDGPGEPRFVKAAWEDEAAGQLAFIGDRIQFQNGFGAHQDMKYICSYDTKADRVISARVYEGRL